MSIALGNRFARLNRFVMLATAGVFLTGIPSSIACCSLEPARFSETIGYAGEGHKDGKLVHLLGYQNTAVNMVAGGGGNALFLPIPAMPGTMSDKNIIDTKKCPKILEDMNDACSVKTKGAMRMVMSSQSKGLAIVQVFESDIYTIVLAQDARAIPGALSRVPEAKRPKMKEEIFDAYAKWYPGWTFALCCFNNHEAAKAKPMLWWYEPKDKNTLFFPALDAHDGNPPKMGVKVDVDHSLVFSTEGLTENKGGNVVDYSDFVGTPMPTSLAGLLPKLVAGTTFEGKMPQGDFALKVANLNDGNLIIDRVLPPGIPPLPVNTKTGSPAGKKSEQPHQPVTEPVKHVDLERQAMINALCATGAIKGLAKHYNQKIVFEEIKEKTAKGWAWIEGNPRTQDNLSHFDSMCGVMRKLDGKWKLVEWVSDDVSHADDVPAAYIKWRAGFIKTHNGCPQEIFPEKF